MKEGNNFAYLEGRVELTVKFEDGVNHEEVCRVLLLEKPQQDFVDNVENIVLQVVVFEVEADKSTY